ncbi:hypothetical protein K439DRAFT_665258 [Ramaria rubella]|nr:hypothetical protein K439DRAFT_665258 [Ramaria rubella]
MRQHSTYPTFGCESGFEWSLVIGEALRTRHAGYCNRLLVVFRTEGGGGDGMQMESDGFIVDRGVLRQCTSPWTPIEPWNGFMDVNPEESRATEMRRGARRTCTARSVSTPLRSTLQVEHLWTDFLFPASCSAPRLFCPILPPIPTKNPSQSRSRLSFVSCAVSVAPCTTHL